MCFYSNLRFMTVDGDNQMQRITRTEFTIKNQENDDVIMDMEGSGGVTDSCSNDCPADSPFNPIRGECAPSICVDISMHTTAECGVDNDDFLDLKEMIAYIGIPSCVQTNVLPKLRSWFF